MHEPPGGVLIRIRTPNARSTFLLGRRIGKTLSRGAIVALSGPLGAGKTVLAKGIASALGVKELVVSPTFTLINEYPGKIPFYHFDLYRVGNISDIDGLGYEEYFQSDGVCVVEWADKFPGIFPWHAIMIRLEHGLRGSRICTIERWNPSGGKKR